MSLTMDFVTRDGGKMDMGELLKGVNLGHVVFSTILSRFGKKVWPVVTHNNRVWPRPPVKLNRTVTTHMLVKVPDGTQWSRWFLKKNACIALFDEPKRDKDGAWIIGFVTQV